MGIFMSDEWLERIERKIDAQTRSHQRLVTEVDRHTAWLESHDKHLEDLDKRLDSHDKRFEGLEKQLDAHGRRLDAIDVKLEAHGSRLDAIDNKLEAQSKQLEAHGKQLGAHGTEQHRLAVLVEKLQGDVQAVAEGLIALGERMDRGFKGRPCSHGPTFPTA